MTESKTEYIPDSMSAPGETLTETLDEIGMSQAELARRMGRPTKTVNEIAKGKAAILPETAFQLENVLGIPASFWLARETAYRETVARRARNAAIQSPEAIEWAKQFPCKEMARRGWIRSCSKAADFVQALFEYFRVASPQAWEATWNRPELAFRKSGTRAGNRFAISAWIRQGEIQATERKPNPFEAAAFKEALRRCRAMTTLPPEDFCTEVQRECGEAGVVALFVQELAGAGVSGATQWLTPQKALIQLSFRFRTDDQLWFSFFHEAAHVLLHPKKGIIVDDGGETTSSKEIEANDFAKNILIPEKDFNGFVSKRRFTRESVRTFATQQSIAPGIVVGRLQHEGLLRFQELNDLKQSLTWSTNHDI